MLFLRQVDQHAAGDRNLRRQPRALGADRVLDDLHDDALALAQDALDRSLRSPLSRGCQMSATCRKAVRSSPTSMKADCMPGRMRHDAPEIDVADQAAAGGAFDVQFLHDALLHDGNAGFLRREIDQDFFGHGAIGQCAVFGPHSTMPPKLLNSSPPPVRSTMMRTAFAFGADAVYAGQPRYSLRVRNNEFGTIAALRKASTKRTPRGKQFFVVSNILPHNAKLTHLPRRHGAGHRPQAGRADHVRPRPDRPGARNLAGACRSICRCRPIR